MQRALDCNLYDDDMPKIKLSEEERERRRELALRLRSEGRFGGPQAGSGRPRKKRASEIAAEQVREEGQFLFDRLMEIARGDATGHALAAIDKLYALEEKEREIVEGEEIRYESMKRDQLLALVVDRLKEISDGGNLEQLLGDRSAIIDAEVVRTEDQRALGTGEGA